MSSVVITSCAPPADDGRNTIHVMKEITTATHKKQESWQVVLFTLFLHLHYSLKKGSNPCCSKGKESCAENNAAILFRRWVLVDGIVVNVTYNQVYNSHCKGFSEGLSCYITNQSLLWGYSISQGNTQR